VFARPALAAGLMGVFASLFHAPAAWLFGPKIGVVLTVVLCVLFYGLMLAAVRALPKEDVLLLPRGERIAKLLRM
jgi:stage V sporulation protein B